MQNETVLKTAIETSTDWQQAVEDFIACTTQIGQPFTSGHVTTILRVYRPEFRFKHDWIRDRCQDLFHTGGINYAGQPAVVTVRTCAGLGRTPAGTPVLTYAADDQDAQNFPFELDIPVPGAGLTQMPQEHPILPAVGVTFQPSLPAAVDMQATVHADKRLCVPRAAFEALLYATGRSLRGGDDVWVRFDNEIATISLDQVPGAVNYDVSKTRGRILFPRPGSGQFVHGDVYQSVVTNGELVIDLSVTV